LFGSEPFSSALRFSNIKEYKYDWTWNKIQGVGHLVAKYRPMQNTEIISVFGKGKINYYPQMTKKNKPMFSDERTGKRTDICGGKISNNYKGKLNTHSHPVTTLNYKKPSNTIRVHPTQKPVDLLEYLIKTYTNEGDIILDFTMGSGTTGVAAKNLNRKFIGIELEKEYFDISIKRLKGEIA
jgi:site-specific DNA-methyltransferase (adenine-specific)